MRTLDADDATLGALARLLALDAITLHNKRYIM
jgi:hypothetical protein